MHNSLNMTGRLFLFYTYIQEQKQCRDGRLCFHRDVCVQCRGGGVGWGLHGVKKWEDMEMGIKDNSPPPPPPQ